MFHGYQIHSSDIKVHWTTIPVDRHFKFVLKTSKTTRGIQKAGRLGQQKQTQTTKPSFSSQKTQKNESSRISTTSDKDAENILENRSEISRNRRPLSS